MFRPKLAVWLLIALVAAWLASCSSNVDGYHLATDESGVSAASTGGASQGAGATGGTSTNGGASTTGGQSLVGSGSSGASGGTGGRNLDAAPDGDSSLGGAGGAPVGGAGGDNTGGVDSGGSQNGGSQNGGAGGSINGGAQNGGAGGDNTGGAPTGGAPTGGRTNTGGATGGAPTGGRSNTGGAPTGGVPTGGAPTGGAPTGGAPTGGAPTGGAPTGGAPTGGVPNTGGSLATGGSPGTGGIGGYPDDPTQVTLTGASVGGITAAAWQPSSRVFYLLKPSTREYFVMTTTGVVTGPNALAGSGTVGQRVFGVNADDVFFASGTNLIRQPISGGVSDQLALPGSPSLGTLTGAHADTWFLVGNASGVYQALSDASSSLTSGAGLSQIQSVTTDGSSFVARALATGTKVVVHRITPGSFSLNPTPCDTGAVGGTTLGAPLGVYQSSVAWVFNRPFVAPLQLNVATIGSNGVCGAALQTDYGTNQTGSMVVGLIDTDDALVNASIAAGTSATIEIRRAGNAAFSRTPLVVSMGPGGYPWMFVVGVEATTHFAVLITNSVPVLISF